MYKERILSQATDGRVVIGKTDTSLYREATDSKKRPEDALDKSSPSTSKGGNGREKERLSGPSTSSARRAGNSDTRTAFEKTKYPDDGKVVVRQANALSGESLFNDSLRACCIPDSIRLPQHACFWFYQYLVQIADPSSMHSGK